MRRDFVPEKCDLNSTCVLCAEDIIPKLINTCTSIIQHLYREIVNNNHEDDFSVSDDDFLGFYDA